MDLLDGLLIPGESGFNHVIFLGIRNRVVTGDDRYLRFCGGLGKQ